MKMQYSKDFTNINSIKNNIIPNNLQGKLGAGLIDSKILNIYNQNPGFEFNSITNSTEFQNMNNDIYNQINNGVEQKFLIEYANKLSHESTIDSPNFSNRYLPPNLPLSYNNQKTIDRTDESDISKSDTGAPFSLNFVEKNSSPIKKIKDLTSGN